MQYQPGLDLPQGSQPGASLPLSLSLFGEHAFAMVERYGCSCCCPDCCCDYKVQHDFAVAPCFQLHVEVV